MGGLTKFILFLQKKTRILKFPLRNIARDSYFYLEFLANIFLFRFYWDLISLAFLIVTMVVIPVGIAFFNEAMTTVPGWMFFNLLLDSCFLIDIIINFLTGIVKVKTHANMDFN